MAVQDPRVCRHKEQIDSDPREQSSAIHGREDCPASAACTSIHHNRSCTEKKGEDGAEKRKDKRREYAGDRRDCGEGDAATAFRRSGGLVDNTTVHSVLPSWCSRHVSLLRCLRLTAPLAIHMRPTIVR